MNKAIENLDLHNKQSIVDLMFAVHNGEISSRRAATEIFKQVPKRHLTKEQRAEVVNLRLRGNRVKAIAAEYNIDPATVWRICNKPTGQAKTQAKPSYKLKRR